MALAAYNAPRLDSPEYRAFTRFIALTIEKRQLNNRLKEIEPELRTLEPLLLSYLGEGGYRMVEVAGYRLAPHREPWVYPARGVTRAEVCSALHARGEEWARFVREIFSTRSLTAYVRQLEEHHRLVETADPESVLDILPPPLAGVLEIKPGFRLQVTKRKNQE